MIIETRLNAPALTFVVPTKRIVAHKNWPFSAHVMLRITPKIQQLAAEAFQRDLSVQPPV
jgi:hypothetical protein